MLDKFGDSGNAAPSGAEAPRGANSVLPGDPIVAEVRAVREALFAEAHYDLDEYVRQARAAQARSTHPVVTLAPKSADTAA